MIKCSKCYREIKEEEGLVHTELSGDKQIICRDCFKAAVGVDYDTFQLRRENARQGCLATVVSAAVTAYAFMEYGVLYGMAGIVLTGLIYYFSAKVR